MSKYSKNIRPYVQQELEQYKRCLSQGRPADAFKHLENAHVLGQESTYLHVLAHIHMALWATRQRDVKEFLGQMLRIIGAATKTAIGIVPIGNTGGSNVSPFKPMQLSAEHERTISQAKANA